MVVRIAIVIIAIAAIAGFALLYGKAIYDVWRHKKAKPLPPTSYVYVATILAGLVGGVAAMMFNEKLPPATTTTAAATPASSVSRQALAGVLTDPAPTAVRSGAVELPKNRMKLPDRYRVAPEFGPRAGGTAFVRSISVFSQENVLATMSAVYMLVYLVVGIAAIVTWVGFGDANTSDLVKNIALISVGLFISILRTFFNIGG